MVYQLIQKRARPCWPGSASGLEGRVKASLPAGIVAGSLVFLALVMPIARGDASPQPEAAQRAATVIEPMPAPRHPREKTYMKRKWGVEILFLRETAAGYMLEFRYKVLDPAKAAPL